MTHPERSEGRQYSPASHERPRLPNGKYFATLETYRGPSKLIKGLQRLQAIGDIPGISYISPVILLQGLYEDYKTSGLNQLEDKLQKTWDIIGRQGTRALILRRLFPNSQGERQAGERSRNIYTYNEFRQEVEKFFQDYADRGYEKTDVLPEIMVHQIIDANNPPKKEGIPHAGGDVTCVGLGVYRTRSTFGADESIQSMERDIWEVDFRTPSKVKLRLIARGLKQRSVVPSGDQDYKEINIPKKYQKALSLDPLQAHSLALACHRLSTTYGPQRLEFNQTIRGTGEIFFITEVEPFELKETSLSVLERFKKPLVLPVMIPQNREEAEEMIEENTVTFAHLPLGSFKRTARGEILTDLSVIAKQKGTMLVVFVSGESANEHAARVLWENGHHVIFIGREEIAPNEKLRVFAKDDELLWEKETPLATEAQMKSEDVERLGGKTLGLMRLKEKGFKVPKFAVIESSLMRRIVETLGIEPLIEKLGIEPKKNLGALIAPIQEMIRNCDSAELRSVIDTIIDWTNTNDVLRLMLRSSANCEDLEEKSFAGHFESFKSSIYPKIIRSHILNIIASVYTKANVGDGLASGIKPSDIKMAIIVQEFIKGHVGTCFTESIKSHEKGKMRIELGAVDEGRGQIILIDKKTGELKTSGESLITTSQIQKLQKQVFEIKAMLFGLGEADIEFVVPTAESSKIVFVQARSLTKSI